MATATTFRLRSDLTAWLDRAAEATGLSKTRILELLIEDAKRKGLPSLALTHDAAEGG